MQRYRSCALSLHEQQEVVSNTTTKESMDSLVGSSSHIESECIFDRQLGEQSLVEKQRSQIKKLMLKCKEQKHCIVELQNYIDQLEQELEEKNCTIQRIQRRGQEEELCTKYRKSEGYQKRYEKSKGNEQRTDLWQDNANLLKQSNHQKQVLKEQLEGMKRRWEYQLKEREFTFHQNQIQIADLKYQNQQLMNEVSYLKQQQKRGKSTQFYKKNGFLNEREERKQNSMFNADFINRKINNGGIQMELQQLKKENKKMKDDYQNLKKVYKLCKDEGNKKNIRIEQLELMKKEEVGKAEREKEELIHKGRLKEAELQKLRSQLSIVQGNNSREQYRKQLEKLEEMEDKQRQKSIRKQWVAEIDKMERVFNEFQLEL